VSFIGPGRGRDAQVCLCEPQSCRLPLTSNDLNVLESVVQSSPRFTYDQAALHLRAKPSHTTRKLQWRDYTLRLSLRQSDHRSAVSGLGISRLHWNRFFSRAFSFHSHPVFHSQPSFRSRFLDLDLTNHSTNIAFTPRVTSESPQHSAAQRLCGTGPRVCHGAVDCADDLI
jgi:hypothetical protein